ncbi:MAG: lipopolysaccharide biosynthesis protein [Rugosibacter sp.]|nr:lipopolysaccharide biosynthesis protein [Rugosibacter sp.]
MAPTNNPKKNLIRGAAWTIGTRWLIKGLGFINTVIMARLLMPEDYGIVAMGMLVVGLIQTFLDFGPGTALLRKAEVTRDEIDSAWTLGIIQGMGMGVMLLLTLPLALDYFNEPRLTFVLCSLAASVIFISFGNIGQVLARKAFIYTLDFKIAAISKIASVATTVSAGLILGDYRALVIGIIAGYTLPVFLSYLWHPYRPRWNTSKIGEIWAVTKWLMLANVGQFILRKGDEFAAGRIGTTAQFGLYNVGSDFGQMPVGEIGPAMLKALLPVLSSLEGNIERTNQAVIKTIAAVNTVIWPIGLGFMAIAAQATEIVLGSKWMDAVPFISLFALASVLQTTTAPANTLLILHGHTRSQSQIIWIEFASFVVAAITLVPGFHLVGLALARIFSSAVNSCVTLLYTKKICQLPITPILKTIVRPLAGSVAMYGLVMYLQGVIDAPVPRLAAAILSGAVFFMLWSLVSWHLIGRPEGLESTIMDKLTQRRMSGAKL